MQTLGLSDSTPRTEGRLKSLFWPSIHTPWDLDYVTTQGFWICTLVGAFTFVAGFIGGGGIFGLLDFIFYLMAGCGVRRRSRVAAVLALTMYFFGGVALQIHTGQGFGVMRILLMAVLVSNVRGIWMSAGWPEPLVETANMTFFDRMSDRLPAILWPRFAWVFYVLAALEILGICALLFPIAPDTGLNG